MKTFICRVVLLVPCLIFCAAVSAGEPMEDETGYFAQASEHWSNVSTEQKLSLPVSELSESAHSPKKEDYSLVSISDSKPAQTERLFYLYLDPLRYNGIPSDFGTGFYDSGVPLREYDRKLLEIFERWNKEIKSVQDNRRQKKNDRRETSIGEEAYNNSLDWLNDALWENINIKGVRITQKEFLYRDDYVYGIPITMDGLKKTAAWKSRLLLSVVIDVPSLEGFDFNRWVIKNSKIISEEPQSCSFENANIINSEFFGPFSYNQIRDAANFNINSSHEDIHLFVKREQLPKDWKNESGRNRFKTRSLRNGVLEFTPKNSVE